MSKVLISACLLGAKVRYDGRDNLLDHPILKRWQQQGKLVTVCPETLGGLPTPRPPAETQTRFPILITTSTGGRCNSRVSQRGRGKRLNWHTNMTVAAP